MILAFYLGYKNGQYALIAEPILNKKNELVHKPNLTSISHILLNLLFIFINFLIIFIGNIRKDVELSKKNLHESIK